MKNLPFFRVPLVLFLLVLFSSLAYGQCTLKMVYKDGGKEPLITAKPKHDGVYYDLFSEAAKRTGCQLEVSRFPKKRLHEMLKEGKLDFYPGASFSKKRAKYLFYIPNGLDTGEYGVSNASMAELMSYEDLKKHNPIWLMEIGSSKQDKASNLGIKVQDRKFFDLQFVSKYIKRSPDNHYFYVADKELVEYFHSQSGMTISQAGLKVHKNCCGGNQPMFLGFSRHSPHVKEQPNPNYDASKKLSAFNYPTILDRGSIAYKLSQALAAMKSEGVTDTIYKRWFSVN